MIFNKDDSNCFISYQTDISVEKLKIENSKWTERK
jgi:hypothetical protein